MFNTKLLSSHERSEIINKILNEAEPFNEIKSCPIDSLISRIGDARIVLLGESTHGTSEFYQMRQKITEELILKKGFCHVAIEADWPDVEHLNRFVRHLPHGLVEKKAFNRFPDWMWKNKEFHSFIMELRHYNSKSNQPKNPVNIYGLDIYNFYQSIDSIISYLDQKDPVLANTARKHYECLLIWGKDLSYYGWSTAGGCAKNCENEVVSMLITLLKNYTEGQFQNTEEFMSIFQNAVSIADAEEYYRSLYQSHTSSWNIRDQHMFETLETILNLEEGAKIVVWAHNTHVGNASTTKMGEHGEFNLGQLCKEKYADNAYTIGFGTHKGTVAASSRWGGKATIKEVKASHPKSIERLCHDSKMPAFFLPLKGGVKKALTARLIQRAIGVVYLPHKELESHYFETILPDQFDEYIWFDHTSAVAPFSSKSLPQSMDMYPFGV